MATPVKPEKGFLNFYKSSTRHFRPKSDTNSNVVTNKTGSISRSFLTRKPKNYQEPVHRGGRAAVEGGGEVVEGRKSVSRVETNLASIASFLHVKVLVSDMPGFMQVHVLRGARTTYDGLHQFSPKHMAYNIKKEFDKVYGAAWHCVVGSSFGSFVTHSTGCFIYFSMEKLYVLVFKTKVQKALN